MFERRVSAGGSSATTCANGLARPGSSLSGVPAREGEAADSALQRPRPVRRVGGHDEDVARRWLTRSRDQAGDAAAAYVSSRAAAVTGVEPRPGVDDGLRPAVDEFPGSGPPPVPAVRSLVSSFSKPVFQAGSPITSIGAGAAAGRAQDQAGLGGAVVAVDLQPHGGVDRLAGLGTAASCRRRTRRSASGRRRRRARTRRGGPPPSARGSSSSAAGTSSETAGLPMPNGLSRSSSSASSRRSASPGATASIRSRGTRSSGVSVRGGVGDERLAERVDAVAGDRQARRRRGGRRSAAARRSRRCRPASRSKPGIERPEPEPSSPSSAISTVGR